MAATSVLPTAVGRRRPPIIELGDIEPEDQPIVGAKAAALARLLRGGLPVPPGFVVTPVADLGGADWTAVAAEAAALGGPLAVRSSAAAEDMAGSSFAGQYESILGVEGDEALRQAIETVRASGASERVERYREARHEAGAARSIAVLIQPMVPAEVAGVAFTADPLTGDRETTIVTAVKGLGDVLAAGEVTPDEWAVRGGSAAPRRNDGGSLTARQASAVASLARRIADQAGTPQDIEWAAVGGRLVVLQARPMTALPEPAAWDPGAPGIWLRNFRFGEWLSDPVSPLFESWALARLEDRLHGNYSRWLGGMPIPRPGHIVINGWYYYGGLNAIPAAPRAMLGALVRHILPSLLRRPRRVAMAMPLTARFGVELFYREWREVTQPRYRAAVARAQAVVATAEPRQLIELVDGLLSEAGDYFTSLTAVAGYAAKAEWPLARFHRRELLPRVGGSHLDLLSGVGDAPPRRLDHAVHTLDWLEPIPANPEGSAEQAAAAERHAAARTRRLEAEARARVALGGDRRRLARFERLLRDAQRYARAREEQAAEFTLAWPTLRQAVERLGEAVVASGALDDPERVFFLTRDDVVATLDDPANLAERAEERKRRWSQARGLVAPLQLGTVPPMFKRLLDDLTLVLRGAAEPGEGLLLGIPASAGRASGPVRIVRSAAEFDTVQRGDVLVASMTTPAWTPLFGRIAALVTDNGGVGAHASIVAREYGLPAVVGTGDATSRLRAGELIEVDGSGGIVRRIEEGG